MAKTLFLTGWPGVGKTTVIKAVVQTLGEGADGFYTEEIRERGKRQGFRLVRFLGGCRRRPVLANRQRQATVAILGRRAERRKNREQDDRGRQANQHWTQPADARPCGRPGTRLGQRSQRVRVGRSVDRRPGIQ